MLDFTFVSSSFLFYTYSILRLFVLTPWSNVRRQPPASRAHVMSMVFFLIFFFYQFLALKRIHETIMRIPYEKCRDKF